MKKSLNLLLVMVLLVSILSACGATPEPQTVVETVVVEKEVPVEVTRIVEVPAEAPAAAGPVTLEVLNPTGVIEITKAPAPRLADLSDKTICLMWGSGLFRGTETFPVLEEMLKERFPTAKIVPYTEMAAGMSAVQEKGCDAVINGNGG